MVRMIIDLPESSLSALRKDPREFAKEMRLAAAAKWYEMGLLSQSRAAEIAGLSRAAFIEVLAHFGVSPFQYDADEIEEEATRE